MRTLWPRGDDRGRPKYSLAADVDYGCLSRLGVDIPNAAEDLVLTDVRVYSLVHKVHVPNQPKLAGVRTVLHDNARPPAHWLLKNSRGPPGSVFYLQRAS
ncbi:hypothetical protein M885DRAFT_623082 [Pelagophyceae sp. CCMP2097]|nr:hypothetical protein M885DRAFT_623082 [Pelagophyceae sp. CCMP2097]